MTNYSIANFIHTSNDNKIVTLINRDNTDSISFNVGYYVNSEVIGNTLIINLVNNKFILPFNSPGEANIALSKLITQVELSKNNYINGVAFGLVGPQGLTGPRGIQGPTGIQGNSFTTIYSTTTYSVINNPTSYTFLPNSNFWDTVLSVEAFDNFQGFYLQSNLPLLSDVDNIILGVSSLTYDYLILLNGNNYSFMCGDMTVLLSGTYSEGDLFNIYNDGYNVYYKLNNISLTSSSYINGTYYFYSQPYLSTLENTYTFSNVFYYPTGKLGPQGKTGDVLSYYGTSSNTFSIPLVEQVINITTQPNLGFSKNQTVLVKSDNYNYVDYYYNDGDNLELFFYANIDSYDVNTGSISLVSIYSYNIGISSNSWEISLSGQPGLNGATASISATNSGLIGITSDGNGGLYSNNGNWVINDNGVLQIQTTNENSLVELGNALGDWASHVRFTRSNMSSTIDSRIAAASDGLIFKNFDSNSTDGKMFSFRDHNDYHLWDLYVGGINIFEETDNDGVTIVQIGGSQSIRTDGKVSFDSGNIYTDGSGNLTILGQIVGSGSSYVMSNDSSVYASQNWVNNQGFTILNGISTSYGSIQEENGGWIIYNNGDISGNQLFVNSILSQGNVVAVVDSVSVWSLNIDGSGYLAGNNISWDSSGNFYSLKINGQTTNSYANSYDGSVYASQQWVESQGYSTSLSSFDPTNYTGNINMLNGRSGITTPNTYQTIIGNPTLNGNGTYWLIDDNTEAIYFYCLDYTYNPIATFNANGGGYLANNNFVWNNDGSFGLYNESWWVYSNGNLYSTDSSGQGYGEVANKNWVESQGYSTGGVYTPSFTDDGNGGIGIVATNGVPIWKLNGDGSVIFDNGGIYSSGYGQLNAENFVSLSGVSFDNGAFWSDGGGNVTANSITANSFAINGEGIVASQQWVEDQGYSTGGGGGGYTPSFNDLGGGTIQVNSIGFIDGYSGSISGNGFTINQGDGSAYFANDNFYIASDGWIGNVNSGSWHINSNGSAQFVNGAFIINSDRSVQFDSGAIYTNGSGYLGAVNIQSTGSIASNGDMIVGGVLYPNVGNWTLNQTYVSFDSGLISTDGEGNVTANTYTSSDGAIASQNWVEAQGYSTGGGYEPSFTDYGGGNLEVTSIQNGSNWSIQWNGQITFDGGDICSSGSGDFEGNNWKLFEDGHVNFDGGAIYSDGDGNIIANSFISSNDGAMASQNWVMDWVLIQGYYSGTPYFPSFQDWGSGLIESVEGINVYTGGEFYILPNGQVCFDNGAITSDGSGVVVLHGITYIPMTTSEISAIPYPSIGMTRFNSTLNTLCFYNGSSWQKVTSTNM